MSCICKAVKALANKGLAWGKRNLNTVFLSLLRPVFVFFYVFVFFSFLYCIQYELYLQGHERVGPIKGLPGASVFVFVFVFLSFFKHLYAICFVFARP